VPSGGLLACLYLSLASLGYSDVSYGVLHVGGGVGVVALGDWGRSRGLVEQPRSSGSFDVRGLGLGEDFGWSESHCCDVVGGWVRAMGAMAVLTCTCGVESCERSAVLPSPTFLR
jgi:hypothetical protein